MGNAIKKFATGVAKAVVTHIGGSIPIVGGALASWVNSKYAKGSYDIGNPGVDTEGHPTKAINTPAQLLALMKANPELAQKAGLTEEMVRKEVQEAKDQSKAIGGKVKAYGKGVEDLDEKSGEPSAVKPVKPRKPKGFVDKLHKDTATYGLLHAGQVAIDAPMGLVKPRKMAVGGKVRSPAQLEATRKLVALNKSKRAKK